MSKNSLQLQESLKLLLKNKKVRGLLESKAVILEVVGHRHFHFLVVNRYYERFKVKISKEGYKHTCAGLTKQSPCVGFNQYLSCYHITACKAWIIEQQIKQLLHKENKL